jgi:hypothetical protein
VLCNCKSAVKLGLSFVLLRFVKYLFAFLFVFYRTWLESVRAGHRSCSVLKVWIPTPWAHIRRSARSPCSLHHLRLHTYTSAAPCAMFQPYIRSPCLLLCCLFLFTSAVNALHFYLDANEKRCFIEELPTDTVVEGQHCQRVILANVLLN